MFRADWMPVGVVEANTTQCPCVWAVWKVLWSHWALGYISPDGSPCRGIAEGWEHLLGQVFCWSPQSKVYLSCSIKHVFQIGIVLCSITTSESHAIHGNCTWITSKELLHWACWTCAKRHTEEAVTTKGCAEGRHDGWFMIKFYLSKGALRIKRWEHCCTWHLGGNLFDIMHRVVGPL